MIRLGEIQKLQIVKSTEEGLFLNSKDKTNEEAVLLPRNQVEGDWKIGDEIQVFIYKDSQDQMIATTRKPKLAIGEVGFLKVVELTKIGAFLDWGLEKDLLLPFKEQTKKVQQGREYLVGMYVDKTGRLCGTMKVSKILSSESPYKIDDYVQGMIYSFNRDIGAFVAVQNKYHGLIPKNEVFGDFELGDIIQARVVRVKADGKLDLSLREKAYKHIEDDAQLILNRMEANKGFLHLNDNSSPQAIKKELNMSKNSFKKAVGRLLKEGKIKLQDTGIEIKRRS